MTTIRWVLIAFLSLLASDTAARTIQGGTSTFIQGPGQVVLNLGGAELRTDGFYILRTDGFKLLRN